MKQYLRLKVWFPNIDKHVENFAQSCNACSAATPQQKHQSLITTAAETVIPPFDQILATHGIPEKVKTDNGPPFNSHDFSQYAKKRVFKHQLITPEQPSANGLAENFMKMLQKVAHTAYVEHKDPKEAVHRYLLSYRAIPHTATGKSPALMLFNRQIATSVLMMKQAEQDPYILEKEAHYKAAMTEYHDQR